MLASEPSDLKFVADINLGTLARWLRLLGYDTHFERGRIDGDFLRRAQQEGRIVLTRKRKLANRQYSGWLVVVEQDHVRRQLSEVIEKTGLQINSERLYSRCALCNALLESVSASDVEGWVTDYVYHQSGPFRKCPDCGKIYWSGTHLDLTLAFLRQHIPVHLP